MFRSIGYEYLGRKDFVHVKAVDEVAPSAEGDEKVGANGSAGREPQFDLDMVAGQQHAATSEYASSMKTQVLQAKVQGYTGEQCEKCGSMRVKQNGTCKVCEDCGTTTGCS